MDHHPPHSAINALRNARRLNPRSPLLGGHTSERRDIRLYLDPDAPEELIRLAERLEQERPVRTAAFRGDLRRRLLAGDLAPSRPKRLRLLIAGYAGAGTALLLIAAASAAGIGPLGV